MLTKMTYLFATVGMLTLGTVSPAFATPLIPGNLVVVQIGNGSAAGGQGTLSPVQLREFTPTGTSVQSIALPTVASDANHPLTINRLTDVGGLSRSTDGRFLVIGGTSDAPGSTPTNGRVIGRIDALGNVDTSTRFEDAYTQNSSGNTRGIRTVVSVDGSAFWISGDGTNGLGVRYVTFGDTSTTAITDATLASRHLTIFDGQLYNSNGTARPVGTGLPTVGTVDIGTLPGLPGGAANSPVFFDLDPNIAGPDTLYVGLEGTNVLSKYIFNGTEWTAANALSAADASLFGVIHLTGRVEDGKVALYASVRTDSANAALGGSSAIVKIVDEGDSYTLSTLATAENGYGFRGIAFTPVPEPSGYVLAAFAVAGTLTLGFRCRSRRIGG